MEQKHFFSEYSALSTSCNVAFFLNHCPHQPTPQDPDPRSVCSILPRPAQHTSVNTKPPRPEIHSVSL